jgi:hypothetical protein
MKWTCLKYPNRCLPKGLYLKGAEQNHFQSTMSQTRFKLRAERHGNPRTRIVHSAPCSVFQRPGCVRANPFRETFCGFVYKLRFSIEVGMNEREFARKNKQT